MRHPPPHLTSPRALWQIMGAPTAGRGTAKDSGFGARASLTALPSWKPRFQFPLPAHRLRGGLFCLCGERLGEGNCHLLMQRERTHFPDEPKEGGSKRRPQISTIFYPESFTNHQASKSQPSPPQGTKRLASFLKVIPDSLGIETMIDDIFGDPFQTIGTRNRHKSAIPSAQ